MKKRFVLLFSMCLFFTINLIAEETVIKEYTDSPKKQALESSTTIEGLEIKLDACKESFDRVITSYWASLGIIVSVILILFGANFVNQNLGKRKEIEILKEQVKNEYEKKYQELLDKINKNYSLKFDLLEETLTNQSNYLRLEILELKLKLEQEKEKPYIPTQLYISVEILRILSKLHQDNSHYSDSQFVKQIAFIIENCKNGIKFDHSYADDVRDMLTELPGRFSKEKNDLENAIRYE